MTEGADVANITLLGQYSQGDFAVSAGPVGGTLVQAVSLIEAAANQPALTTTHQG